MESFLFAWRHNVLDTSAFYFCFVNNTEGKLSRSLSRWCAGSDTAATEIYHHRRRHWHICWVSVEGKDKRMWSPFVKCVRCFSQHRSPNSLLSYMSIIAHFSLTANSHHAHLSVHHTWTGTSFLCQDLGPNPVNLNGHFSESILIALIIYQK